MVRYYSKELTLISNGYKASSCFSEPQRRKLTKIGVLERVYMHRGCRLKLSEKAREIMVSVDPWFPMLP